MIIWNKFKLKYLGLSIATGILQFIFYSFVLTYFVISLTNKIEYTTIEEYLSSTPFIILITVFSIMIPLIILTIMNRVIMFKIFLNPDFINETKLDKNKWFFSSKTKIYIFISLHFSIPGVGIFLATTTYKNIQDNNNQIIE